MVGLPLVRLLAGIGVGRYRCGVATLGWCHLGRAGYAEARRLQEGLAERRRSDSGADLLLTLEHPPVLTLGRNSAEPRRDWAAQGTSPTADGTPVLRVDRGGGLTYHGPGQLVAYPVVALRSGGRAVRALVEILEESLCEVAAASGVVATTRAGFPGAWVMRGAPPRKLGSVGLGVRRGVSLHGAALNVERRAAEGFAGFAPCGLEGVAATSLEAERNAPVPDLAVIAQGFARAFARRLGCAQGPSVIDAAALRFWPRREPHEVALAAGCEGVAVPWT